MQSRWGVGVGVGGIILGSLPGGAQPSLAGGSDRVPGGESLLFKYIDIKIYGS